MEDETMSGWVRFENAMPENLKVAPVSDRAFRLWVHAICYCSRAQTDGLVPAPVAVTLSSTGSKRVVAELVGAGLFEPVDQGYRVHDYLDHNPSRSRIAQLKGAARERTARWRDGDVTRHEGSSVTHHVDSHNGVTSTRDLPLPTLTEENEVFAYWQERCRKPRAKFTAERRQKVRARRAEKYSVQDMKQGVDGAALNPPRDRDSGVVHDDLVSICRNGAQLERYMARATAQPLHVVKGRENASDWLRDMDAADVIDAQVVEEGEAS